MGSVAAETAAGSRRADEGLDRIGARVLVLAVWFGTVTGLVEVALFAVKKFALHRIVHVSPHVVWMAPLADILMFSLAGLLLIGLARLRPRLAHMGIAAGVFAFLSFFTLSLHYTPVHIAAKALLAAGLGVQAGRMVSAHPAWFGRLVGRTLGWTGWAEGRGPAAAGRDFPVRARHIAAGAAALLACLAGAVHAHGWIGERSALAGLPPGSRAPNIVLIVWDTVRAMSLSLYGYERQTTPRLDAFARGSTVFERALATAPWTLPTHASIFTGHWHHELAADWDTPLDDTYPTLAEFLAGRGYLTAGFVANTFFGSFEHGLDRGFARYEDYRISPGQILISSALGNMLGCGIRSVAGCRLRRLIGYHDLLGRKSSAHVNSAFLDWLDGRDGERPFFAFLNYFDAHAPYLPPEPFASRFGRGRRGNPMQLDDADWTWTADQVRAEQDAYDGAIAYLDDQLGRLLDSLERRGLLEETIVVITSDHGEEFLEHGVMAHSNSLYLPSLHVPLVIHSPEGLRVGSVPALASLRDVPATLMDLLGIADHPFPGRSLARLSWADAPAPETLHADLTGRSFRPAHYPVSRGDMRSVVVDPFHYIRNGDGREELYDVRLDPWETNELTGTPRADSARTRLRLKVEQSTRGHGGTAAGGGGQ